MKFCMRFHTKMQLFRGCYHKTSFFPRSTVIFKTVQNCTIVTDLVRLTQDSLGLYLIGVKLLQTSSRFLITSLLFKLTLDMFKSLKLAQTCFRLFKTVPCFRPLKTSLQFTKTFHLFQTLQDSSSHLYSSLRLLQTI